jgi:ABC-2 type transport system ATP-binding protein
VDSSGDEPALVVRDLVRRYGRVTAVDRLSLQVRRGELVAVLGPNGAGKTSTVDVCEGFARPSGGEVRVLGLDPWRDRRALRPRLGVMLQAGGAHAAAKAKDMLHLVADCAAHPHDPDWLLDVLGLHSVAATPVRRLSGGQVQRLSLAMALIGRPEMLFLDEPTAGMDPQARRLVWDLLRSARADGVTILLTTHLLDEAELLADRVVIIDRGRVVASGTPAELTADIVPVLRFDASPGLDLRLLAGALPAGMEVAEPTPGRYQVRGQIGPETMATVTSFCARVGVLPTAVEIGRRRLDEVYLQLTGNEVRP